MGRKSFISYKYSESQSIRDNIIKALGEDARFYKGETVDSPDQTDNKAETIKRNLSDMIFDTSVTIVVLSPNMIQSKWIDWEVEYSLKEISREDKTSRANGIVCVVGKFSDSYDWLVKYGSKSSDNCTPSRNFEQSKLYPIINKNRFNQKVTKYLCDTCKTYDSLQGSYISVVDEHVFLADPYKYIENAYEKSQNIHLYNVCKTIRA